VHFAGQGPGLGDRDSQVTNYYSPITNHAFSSGKTSAGLRNFRRSGLGEFFQAAG
jgi:hypothetical protein